ncbi:MAG: hypothetical protein ACYCZU_02375 [Devosia sp.]
MAILGREHLRDLANAKVNDAVLLFEHGRYEAIDEFRATAMRNAMLHAEFGVYKWLQSNW